MWHESNDVKKRIHHRTKKQICWDKKPTEAEPNKPKRSSVPKKKVEAAKPIPAKITEPVKIEEAKPTPK